ncbi:PA2779 family protein [Zhongshania sp. BJYM1]|uniref:PA2779 family protein n=1 Tax=Zhongshania aquatica TaxID=2965069 RepID=UPI0022B41A5F|nr:PA2779 family protein [Marortus sp. BJYM1]
MARTTLKRSTTAIVMSGFMVWTGVMATTASASVIGTDHMVAEYAVKEHRAEMKAALSQDNVRERLVELGVSPADVEARIDALTPAELAMLQEKMDQLPAGAGAVGLLALLVLIFFITDILGITDIFPFVNAAN